MKDPRFKGRKMVQIAWFDVTGDAANEDWGIDSYQDIDEAVREFIKEEETHLERELTFSEVKILVKFVEHLKNTHN